MTINRAKSRLPTMTEAVAIITLQSSRREQIRQLRFMAETQGRQFAETVKSKVRESKGFKS